jgi:hypothetical protein
MSVTIKLPSDVGTLIKGRETVDLVTKSISNKLLEMEIGDWLAGSSSLKQDDVDELDHLIKKGLYKRVKNEAGG